MRQAKLARLTAEKKILKSHKILSLAPKPVQMD